MRGPADPVTAKVEEKDLRQRLAALEAEAAPASGDPLTAYQRRWLERPGTLERFLRADGGKVAKAGRRLRDTLKWREDARPERVCCQACAANEHAHYMHQVGFATTGQPLVYSDIGKAKDKRPESNVEHCIQVLERTTATMDHDHGVETFVWLIDFHGFSSRDLNPRMATSCLKIFSRNYPERMGRIVMVEAPWLFNAMFEFLKTVVDPVTVAKVVFVKGPSGKGGGGELAAFLDSVADAGMKEWILAELAENRKKDVVKRKSWVAAVRGKDGETVAGSGHDLRGPPSFLKSEAYEIASGARPVADHHDAC